MLSRSPGNPINRQRRARTNAFTKTLFRWLDKQNLAFSREELQGQVDTFDQIYNNEGPHHGLPGLITSAQAWEATPKANPPRPRNQQCPVGWDGVRRTTVAANDIAQVRLTWVHVTRLLAGHHVCLVETDQHLLVFDDQETQLMNTAGRGPESNTSARDHPGEGGLDRSECHRCVDAESVTDVLRQNCQGFPET